jgi:hypothetical protein
LPAAAACLVAAEAEEEAHPAGSPFRNLGTPFFEESLKLPNLPWISEGTLPRQLDPSPRTCTKLLSISTIALENLTHGVGLHWARERAMVACSDLDVEVPVASRLAA